VRGVEHLPSNRGGEIELPVEERGDSPTLARGARRCNPDRGPRLELGGRGRGRVLGL
jgi:hypothetical protein